MKKIKYKNQFLDSFKILTDAKQNILNLRKNITYALNRSLPGRILSKANIFNMTIDVAQDLANLVMLNVEDSLIEQNILIAQKELSVRGLATLPGHQATRAISSTGVIKIIFKPMMYQKSPAITFDNLVLKCDENNLLYFSENSNLLVNEISGYYSVKEGSWVKSESISMGLKLERISLDDSSPIENSNIKVKVNGESFTLFDSLYDMKSTSKGYLIKNGIGSQVDIVFGDGINGVKLNEGDKIEIEYLITNGELGNLDNLSNATFKIISGTYDINGLPIDINEDIIITAHSGFVLGSNGEDIEKTRVIAGYNSRALVFTRPENVISYLSRLSILSHINVWNDRDDNVYKILLLPNIKNKLSEFRDYLNLSTSDMILNKNQKDSIKNYLNESGAQATTTELLMVDPEFSKYVVFVYVTGNIIDKINFKKKVENNISEVFLNNTFLEKDLEANGLITRNEIIDAVTSIDGVEQCNVNMFSEENEIALINSEYTTEKVVYNGSTKTVVNETIYLKDGENPNLGFNELGGICTNNIKHIPILKGGFKFSKTNEIVDHPIYIFYKQNGIYESI